jgi:hypothetical protein
LQETVNEVSLFQDLHDQLNRLGGQLNLFIQSVESQHLSVCEEGEKYIVREETG